jgi:predicted permease
MLRLVRDPFFWGSLLFIAAFPAFDFYILEANYYDSGAFFRLSAFSLLLVAAWLIWIVVCFVVAGIRWPRRGWSGAVCLAVAALVFPMNILLGSRLPWQHYNFYRFNQARQDYARVGDGNGGKCKAGRGTPRDLPAAQLSIDDARPESHVTAAGTYVLYPIFLGTNGFSGFLYAPSLDDPIKELPELNLGFAKLWDREACVFLVGNQ